MEQSFANDNMINGNNKTIEIFMNDVVLEDKYGEIKTQVSKQKQVVSQRNNNERKFEKIAFSKEKLEATWNNLFMFEFPLCE
jgi:hypothetical protein